MSPLDLAAVFNEHGGFVWRVLRHLGVAESLLDDLSQEVFMVLLERPDAFQGRSSMRTFLYGVCRNIARSARRKPSLLWSTDQPPEQEAPALQESGLLQQENRRRLIDVLRELTEEQRMIFVLYEIEEVSMEEIAAAMKAPLRTCYSRLEAARKQVEARFRRKLLVSHMTPREVLE